MAATDPVRLTYDGFWQRVFPTNRSLRKTFLSVADHVVSEDNRNLNEMTQPMVELEACFSLFPREDRAEDTRLGDSVASHADPAASGAGAGDAPAPTCASAVPGASVSDHDLPDPTSGTGAGELGPDLDDPRTPVTASRVAEPGRKPGAAFAHRDEVCQATPTVLLGYDATRAIDSHHLRAARALLGWAMSDLARVSGLSLSTIRRLEQNAQAVSVRNHQAAVDALRMGGIRFLTLDDGTTAVAELGHMPALLRVGSPRGDSSPR